MKAIDMLSRLVSQRGAPACYGWTRDSSSCLAFLQWIVNQDVETALIKPGKPRQKGVTESFSAKLRDECLSIECLRLRAEAKVVIEAWRRFENTLRPHSSLGYLTPAALAATPAEAV